MTFLIDKKVSCVIMHNNPLINEESHCTASFHSLWLLFYFVSFLLIKMSWAKQSTEAGLVGLTEREEARGAFCEEAFQFMPTPDVKHVIVVSTFKSSLFLHVLNVEDIEDKYLQSSVYLFQLDDEDDDWVDMVPDPQNRQKENKPFLVVSCIFTDFCVHSTVYSV